MNRSDRDPDAYDRIRDDALTEQKWKWPVAPDGMSATVNARLQEQAARIASLESELKTMTSAADDRIRDDASVLGRTCGYCGFTGDMMSYAQHVCPRDVMQSEIDSLRAQLAAATERERVLRGTLANFADIENWTVKADMDFDSASYDSGIWTWASNDISDPQAIAAAALASAQQEQTDKSQARINNLPQASDLEGMDFTGGIDPTEYIRRLRSELDD